MNTNAVAPGSISLPGMCAGPKCSAAANSRAVSTRGQKKTRMAARSVNMNVSTNPLL